MSVIHLPSQFNSQPQRRVPIDRNVWRGSSQAFLPSLGFGGVIGGSETVTLNNANAPFSTVSTEGRPHIWRPNTTTQPGESYTWETGDFNVGANASIIVVGAILSAPSFFCGVSYGGSSWGLWLGFSGTQAIAAYVDSPTSAAYTATISGLSNSVGQYRSIGLTKSGNTVTVFFGGQKASASGGNGGVRRSAGSGMIGQGTSVDGRQYYAAISMAAICSTALADAEMLSLLNSPYRIFKAPPRSLYFDFGAGGGTTQPLSASGAATASGSASLASTVALAGVGVAVAGGSAVATGTANLDASGAAQASGTAGAVVDVALSALGLAVASGSASLDTAAAGSLSAAGGAVSGGAAEMFASVTISASGLAQAAGAAGLSSSALLAGAGAAQAAGNAALSAELAALAAGAAQAGGSATLAGGSAGVLDASGAAQAVGSAALTLSVRLAATGSAQADGSADLTGGSAGDIAASGGSTAAGSGLLTAEVVLTAAGFAQAMGAGYLVVQVPLAASGAAQAGGGALLASGSVQVLISDARFSVQAPARNYRVGRR